MIFRDNDLFLTDETYDGMDSNLRASIANIFNMKLELGTKIDPMYYLPGMNPVRHPLHYPSNNHHNFTRDQLIPLVASMYKSGYYDEVWILFVKLMRRFFFCFNTERDAVLSKKKPYPHAFYKDSKPNCYTTFILNRPLAFEKDGYTVETRLFDGPDPLFPHHIHFILCCARSPLRYISGIIGVPLFILSMIFHSKKIDSENNQMLCMVAAYDCMLGGDRVFRFYQYFNHNWYNQIGKYYAKRRELEYSNAIIKWFYES